MFLSVKRYRCSRKLFYLQDVLPYDTVLWALRYCAAPSQRWAKARSNTVCSHMKRNASRTLRNCFFDFICTKFGKIICCCRQVDVSLSNILHTSVKIPRKNDINVSELTVIPFLYVKSLIKRYVLASRSVHNSGKYTNVTTVNV
jgi:hypothetical protein